MGLCVSTLVAAEVDSLSVVESNLSEGVNNQYLVSPFCDPRKIRVNLAIGKAQSKHLLNKLNICNINEAILVSLEDCTVFSLKAWILWLM